jgi:thiol:disulfide interchange protein DsbD
MGIMIGGYFLFDSYINTAEESSDGHNSENNVNSNGNGETIEIKWRDYNEGLQLASSNNKPVMIDFYTDWCGYCDDMDRDTYGDSRVIEKSKDFVCIKVDGDVRQDLINSYAITGYPTTLFLNSQEAEINRVSGYMPPGPFLNEMDKALKEI